MSAAGQALEALREVGLVWWCAASPAQQHNGLACTCRRLNDDSRKMVHLLLARLLDDLLAKLEDAEDYSHMLWRHSPQVRRLNGMIGEAQLLAFNLTRTMRASGTVPLIVTPIEFVNSYKKHNEWRCLTVVLSQSHSLEFAKSAEWNPELAEERTGGAQPCSRRISMPKQIEFPQQDESRLSAEQTGGHGGYDQGDHYSNADRGGGQGGDGEDSHEDSARAAGGANDKDDQIHRGSPSVKAPPSVRAAAWLLPLEHFRPPAPMRFKAPPCVSPMRFKALPAFKALPSFKAPPSFEASSRLLPLEQFRVPRVL